MASCNGFPASDGHRRRRRQDRRSAFGKTNKEEFGGNAAAKMDKVWHQSIHRGFGQRPNAEWDYRGFTVTVAKADQQAIGAGIEKMISERHLMASYNWDVNSWFPTIIVPGAPKIFYPWSGGLLEVSNEAMTIDEDSFRIPNAPMEPLFTAVRLCQPDFKLNDVDLVADLNCLKKLLRFVIRAAFVPVTDDDVAEFTVKMDDIERNVFAGANKESDFRVDCQVIGNTVVMMRRESEHRGRAMGFGVGYLNACTKPYQPDPNASGPYKRISYLKFGSLRLLLRHKVLAAIYPAPLENAAFNGANKKMNGSGDGSWPSSMGGSSIRYMTGGYLGDHNGLDPVELASISKMKSRLVVDKWLDMLFIGSDNLYFGEHVHGRFQQPTMRRRAEVMDLSGLQASDGRRILYILEMLLKKIIRYGQSSAAGSQGCKESVSGSGDADYQQNLKTEPYLFTIISSNECRKLGFYKTKMEKGNKRSDAATGGCVSDGMMAALLGNNE